MAGCLAGTGIAAPVIAEFMAVNSGAVLVDEDGDSSDWLEIFNPGAAPVALGGFGLSDDPDLPLRWTFPAIALEPGARLVVFASGKDRRVPGANLHTNFSLGSGGEFLGLADAGGNLISGFVPEYPEQQRDISFGLDPAGGIGYMAVPTPGAPNGPAVAELTPAPEFSVAHGYFRKAIVLEIVSPSGDSTVLYTTDGSVPTRLNGQVYREPIVVGATAVFRAIALRPGAVPSPVVTSSYLFPGDIKNQPGMSQLIVGAEAYAPEIEAALAGLPAISLSMPEGSFLGPDGIYTNFQERGRAGEVPVSVEYFDPQGEGKGDGGFQIDAGIRIHGGQARFHEKKPLRLHFRSDYGAGRLNYPLFAGNRVQEFDRLVLRSCGHDSWAIDWGFGRNDLTDTATYLRDEFLRRSEQAMGLLSPQGKFVHVFINGAYWGMYDLHERADAAFFASHEGGGEGDWDVIEGGGLVAEGDATAWNDLLGLGTVGVTTAAQFAQIEQLLDMDSFIDSMISRIWSGDNDWLGPVYFGTFSTGANNRNWYAGRRSRGGREDEPFHFFAWDAEISLGNDRFTSSGNHLLITDLTQVNTAQSPSVPYHGLRGYSEFKLQFADRLYRHFFNDGKLTPAQAIGRWDELSARVRGPVVAESARWGNIHGGVPLRRNAEWEAERRWVRDTFLVQRTGIVLNQFKARGLYPSVDPPEFTAASGGHHPGPVEVGLAAPGGRAGEIFYTLDGADPRRAASVEVAVLLPQFAPAKVLVPSLANGGSALGDAWKEFADPPGIAGWTGGEAAVGFETQGTDYRSLLRVDVEDEMFGVNASVYMRVEFELPDQAAIDAIGQLVLKMKYDDGFIAYLNGERVAARNAPASPAWDSTATDGQPDSVAVLFQEFDISAQRGRLRVGRNVLALQGLNGSTESSDLLLVPQLIASGAAVSAGTAASAVAYAGEFSVTTSTTVRTRFLSSTGVWSALREEAFVIGDRLAAAGDLVLSEINYNPRDAEGAAEVAVTKSRGDFEFLEVMNVSGETLQLGGVGFVEGVDFVFPDTSVPAGRRVLVVKHLAAFRARYPSVPDGLIAGEFGGDTGLANGGERLVLVAASGAPLLDFEYDDRSPWPLAADGDGNTLVLVDPLARPDHGLASNWRASRLVDGSPGDDEDRFDLDLDGLPDDWEQFWFGDLAQLGSGDLDGDGWDHVAEFAAGTNPLVADTDGDGLPDPQEAVAGTDPLQPDTDGDGLSDGEELLTFGGDPLLGDSDGDGLDDGFEARVSGTRLDRRDSDGDGSSDFSEVRRGSDPRDARSVALARASDLLIYASMDSAQLVGGGKVSPGATEVAGALGGALRLAPAVSVEYRDVGDPGFGSLSAVFWFKLAVPSGSQTLVSKGGGWSISVADGKLSLQLAGLDPIALADRVPAGGWHQLAMVVDAEIGVMRGFFDGAEVGSVALGSGLGIDSPAVLQLGGNGSAAVCVDEFSLLQFPLSASEVGAIFRGAAGGLRTIEVIGSGDLDLDGLADDWELAEFGDLDRDGEQDGDADGLSNRREFELGTDPQRADSDGDGAGDQAEVLAGSDPRDPASVPGGAPGLRDGLLLYSSFDRETVTGTGSGSRVFDLTQPAENGTVSGAIGAVPGRVGEASRLSSGLISYGDSHNPGAGSYSVSAWFQADHLAPGLLQRVVGKGEVGVAGGSTGWQILLFGDEVAAIGGLSGGGEWFLRGMPAAQARLRVGDWNHVALVIDRSPGAGRVSLFVNGAEIAAAPSSSTALPDGAAIVAGRPLTTHAGAGAATNFAGAIDELAIWGRAISGTEVSGLFRGGVVASGPDALDGAGGQQAEFSALPGEIALVLNPGEKRSLQAIFANQGDGRAQWFAQLEFDSELTLDAVIDKVDSGAARLLDTIPFRFAFTGGETGASIGDGGLDMYDTGNILNTNLGARIPYSDGVVLASAAFGADGRYVTRKLDGGLFVLAADLDGVDFFEISGELGADGVGAVDGAVLTVERNGRRFLGFVKRVYDGFDSGNGLFDPSVNHLIIVEDNGEATQSFNADTDSDRHRVADLTGVQRLYYLLYASQEGIKIDDDETQQIFETFIDTVGVQPGWVQATRDEGQIEAGGEFVLGLEFEAGSLAPGIEVAALRVFSNDPEAAETEIPIRLRINAAPFMRRPFEAEELEDSGPVLIDLAALIDDDGADDGEALAFELLTLTNPKLLDAAGSSIAGSVLRLALVADGNGLATVTVRATDPQGRSTIAEIDVRIEEVNDVPFAARELLVVVAEDSGPVSVPLRSFFDDVEDGADGLGLALGDSAPGSPIGQPSLDPLTGVLEFALIADAYGLALVPVRVTDSEGAEVELLLRIEVTPVADAPEPVGSIPPITADDAASDSSLPLAPFFRDRDTGEGLRYTIVGNTNPQLFESLAVGETSGQLAVGFAPFVSGRATITVRATDPTGRSADQLFDIVLPPITIPEIVVEQAMRLNRQTGLWEQTVRINNRAQRDIGAVRLLVSGLPDNVSVYNASSQLPDGRSELVYNRTLPAGESATMIVEYYSPQRTSSLSPAIAVEVSLRRSVSTVGESFAIDRLVPLPDGSPLIEFPSEPGALYLVQTSRDMRTWHDSLVRLRAGGTRVQWIDRDTSSGAKANYYRVLRLPE